MSMQGGEWPVFARQSEPGGFSDNTLARSLLTFDL